MFIDMKAKKVWQLMHLSALKYNLWGLVYDHKKKLWFDSLFFNEIYSSWQKKGKYKYEYIQFR